MEGKPKGDFFFLVTKSSNSFVTPWTAAFQVPLSMGFPRQEYWNGLPFPSPGDLPNLEFAPTSPAWQADSLPQSHLHCCKYLVFGHTPGDMLICSFLQPDTGEQGQYVSYKLNKGILVLHSGIGDRVLGDGQLCFL